MKYGPFIFLGLLVAMSLSWLGMIVTPQFQLGSEQPTNVPPANILYPVPQSGLAQVGREVYRANGCAYCHTQVVRQDGNKFDVVLTGAGTNQTDLVTALTNALPRISAAEAQRFIASLPAVLATETHKPAADALQKSVSVAGAEVSVRTVPVGPDIERGWGKRLSVAHDYIYASPLLLGTTRLGPDLANVGLRRPDAAWHFLHLYDAKLEVPGSTMPRYPFLFEKRPKGQGRQPSDALPIPGNEEIVPTAAAKALVAYLVTLKAEPPLFEAPGPQLPPPAAPVGVTNLPPVAPTADTNTPAPGSPDAAARQITIPSNGVITPKPATTNAPAATNQAPRP